MRRAVEAPRLLNVFPPRSHSLFSLREEAHRSDVSAPHRPEPHRSGHRRDEQEGGRDQAAVLLQWGGHDPPPAQTAGQHQRPGVCFQPSITRKHQQRSHSSEISWPPCLWFRRWMPGHSRMPEPFWTMLAPRSTPTTKWSSWRRSSG